MPKNPERRPRSPSQPPQEIPETDGMRAPHRPETCEPAGVRISDDITKKSKRESESSVSEPQPENTARAGRACDDDYPDRIVHHNERPPRDRPVDQSEPQTDPAPVKDHEPETEENPFLEWDGEEGQTPHN